MKKLVAIFVGKAKDLRFENLIIFENNKKRLDNRKLVVYNI